MMENEHVRAFVCGGGASVIAKTTTAPLERVKILLQTQDLAQRPGASRFSGMAKTLVRVHGEQGLVSLWRGNLTNCARVMPTYALRFTVFDIYQGWFQTYAPDGGPLPLLPALASGALSGATGAFFSHPLDLLRTRMSAETVHESSRVQKHIFTSCKDIIRTEGVVGFYKGLVISLLEITPYVMISMGGYNYLKSRLPRDTPEGSWQSIWSKLFVGWVSGLAGSLTCYPIDTVKRSLMLDGSSFTGRTPQFKCAFFSPCLHFPPLAPCPVPP
jgi:hypothetical protein